MTRIAQYGAWHSWFGVALFGFCLAEWQGSLSAQEPKERASFGGHAMVVSSVAVTADGSGSTNSTANVSNPSTTGSGPSSTSGATSSTASRNGPSVR